MVIKHGRFGTFAACPGYPECKNTKAIDKKGNVMEKKTEEPEKTDMKCEKCGGDIVIRSSSYGRFYACSNFPKCRYTKAILEPIGVKCPKCGGDIVKAYGKKKNLYYRCEKYPECDFSSWDLPTAEKCPKCGKMLFEKTNFNVDAAININHIVEGDNETVEKEEVKKVERKAAAPNGRKAETPKYIIIGEGKES